MKLDETMMRSVGSRSPVDLREKISQWYENADRKRKEIEMSFNHCSNMNLKSKIVCLLCQYSADGSHPGRRHLLSPAVPSHRTKDAESSSMLIGVHGGNRVKEMLVVVVVVWQARE